MNSWSNAIIVCIVLVAGAWLLVVNSPAIESPKPEPKPPGPQPVVQPAVQPVIQPVESVSDINRSFLRDARGAIAVIARFPEASAILARAFGDMSTMFRTAQTDLRSESEPVAEHIPPKWTPTERQVVLYFYEDSTPHAHARQLIQQGHTVYRAGSHRQDLRLQFDARAPLWLVIREGRVIYRSQRAPRFTVPVQQAPVYQSAPVHQYQSAPVYRGGFSCAGGICQ